MIRMHLEIDVGRQEDSKGLKTSYRRKKVDILQKKPLKFKVI